MKNLPILLVLLTGCGDKDTDSGETASDDTGTPAVDLPDYSQPGEHAVGTLSAEIVGSTGVDLTLQVWYPADEPGSELAAYDGFLEANAAYSDVAPSCATARPVLVFSHGYGGIRWQSPFLMEHLASHGYVVVAPDHTYNTFLDDNGDYFEEVVVRRPQDLSDSFDWLVAQSADTASSLAGCVDEADGFAVSGHSFGGYTTYATAGALISDGAGGTLDLSDDRVWAALPLAPWDVYGILGEGASAITVPVMCLSGDRDTTTDWDMVTGIYDNLTTTPRYLGEFPAAGHYSFAPITCTLGTTDNGCSDEDIDLDLFAGIVNTAVLSFLEETRGLTGAIAQLPEDSEHLTWQITE